MKNINFDNLEILSPAGNPECFYADINSGCDAIYLGLSDFNARMKAENFTTQNIREYIKYAHKFGVKVYVTTNTLIEDEDFDKFLQMAKTLVDAKIDAFIVQDFGVAHLLKTCFSNINIHASTQMGIHNLEGAKIAESLGFSRIVLSRETKLEDIKEIKNNTNLEIEYFVQGALCVAFSGNCYLSSLEKNASGNEGKCLQLCRLPYTNNLNNKTAYYLSARDLSLLDNIKSLIEAGVTSFKIEGRMRHAGYAATATKIYKNALSLLKTSNTLSKEFLTKSENELKISYSRGDYNKNAYLSSGVTSNIIFKDYQNHIGKKIGTVKSVVPFKENLYKATLALNTEISEGDGLKIIDSKTKTQVASLGVGNVQILNNNEYIIFTKNNFKSGLDVHLTQSAKNEEKILKNQRKIKINIKINAFAGKNLEVFASSDTCQTNFKSDYLLEKATKSPISENDFKSQFEKLSDTSFILTNFKDETDGIFLPKSKLNEARRQVIELFEAEIISQNEKHLNIVFDESAYNSLCQTKIKTLPTNIMIQNNFKKDFEPNKNTIYVYSPDTYSKETILLVHKILKDKFALALPTILNFEDKQVLNSILDELPKNITLFANNIYGFDYIQKGYSVIASPLCNIKNSFAIKCLNKLGISQICASVEASSDFAEANNLVEFESGNFPLMTFAHCPYKTIFENDCNTCKFNNSLEYSNPNLGCYKIKRTKLKNCQFELCKNLNRSVSNFFIKNLRD